MNINTNAAFYHRIRALTDYLMDVRVYAANSNQNAPHGHPCVHALESLIVDLAAIHGRFSVVLDLARDIAAQNGDKP